MKLVSILLGMLCFLGCAKTGPSKQASKNFELKPDWNVGDKKQLFTIKKTNTDPLYDILCFPDPNARMDTVQEFTFEILDKTTAGYTAQLLLGDTSLDLRLNYLVDLKPNGELLRIQNYPELQVELNRVQEDLRALMDQSGLPENEWDPRMDHFLNFDQEDLKETFLRQYDRFFAYYNQSYPLDSAFIREEIVPAPSKFAGQNIFQNTCTLTHLSDSTDQISFQSWNMDTDSTIRVDYHTHFKSIHHLIYNTHTNWIERVILETEITDSEGTLHQVSVLFWME